MKLKRAMAILLALLMLLGLMPTAALAATSEHEHNWGNGWWTSINPSCTQPGKETRQCIICGEQETRDVAPLGHDWGAWSTTRAATCAADGEEMRSCSRCQTTEIRAIPATGHSFGDWSTTRAATCTAGGEEARKCSVCGNTETRATGTLGHSFGEWSTTRAATCAAEGEEARSCSRCGTRETRAIPLTDHQWGKWKTKREPTCDKKGEEERKCSVCGQIETRDIKKLPHTYGDWSVTREPTCSEKGEQTRTCEACGYVDVQAIDTLPHTYGDWRVTREPTCTEKGERTHACQVCGHEETEAVDMVPHAFGEWDVSVEATCTQGGKQAHVCATCGLEEREDVPPKGHLFGEWNVIAEMTDFSIGVREHSCLRCGLVEHEEEEPQPTYRRGDKGDGVKELQEKLNAAGYDCGAADGIFGKKTEAAVQGLEAAHDFETDGIAWPGVQKWLGDAAGKGPDDEGSAPFPSDINSTFSGGAPNQPPVFTSDGVFFHPRQFVVESMPEQNSAYYEGANVLVKLRLDIDEADSYRVVKYHYDQGDTIYSKDWMHGGETLEPLQSYYMSYSMHLGSDIETWRKRTVTVWLKSKTTGIVEKESVSFGPPFTPAKVTIIDKETASHIAGDNMAFLYLNVNKDAYSGHRPVFENLDIPINVDSDGNTEIRNLKLTVEQVNVNHSRVLQTDVIDLKKAIMAGDSFDWLASVKASPVSNFAETHSIHLKVTGVYVDKYGDGQTVESNMVSLSYFPEKVGTESPKLALDYSVKPVKNQYGPGDRVTIRMTATNNGSEPLKNVTVDFIGPSKALSAKWEPIDNIPAGTVLQPGESAEATWSYTLVQQDFDNEKFEADLYANANWAGSDAKITSPSAHVAISCLEFLQQSFNLNAEVLNKQSFYPAGSTVPVRLTIVISNKTKLQRTRVYAVGDNWSTGILSEKAWRDFGHGEKGYEIGEMGPVETKMSMVVDVTIPEDFAGDIYRPAWMVEADNYGSRTFQSNRAAVGLPVFPLADESSELSLQAELRTVCPHKDGVWRPGDKVDVKLTSEYKGPGTAKRLLIEGADQDGNQPVYLLGEDMNAVSDTVQLTLGEDLFKQGSFAFTFRARANVKDAARTDYITGARTMLFDLTPQEKGAIQVKASVISENLNPDGKWHHGDKALVRVEASYKGEVIPNRMEFSAYRPGNTESPFKHETIWYATSIADEFIVQLDANDDKGDGVIAYPVTAYACEGDSDVYTCQDSTTVVFEMSQTGSGPDAAGKGPDASGMGVEEAAVTTEAAAGGIEDMPEDGGEADTGEQGAEIEAPAGTVEVSEESAPTETTEGTEESTTTETAEGTVESATTETAEGTEESTTTETTEGTEESTPPETTETAETTEEGQPAEQTGEGGEAVPAEADGIEADGESEPDEPGYVENIVSIPGTGYEIPATVCLPAGEGPFPAVVMLHGTGSTRDEAGDGYRYAAPILADQYGIATIRIDFPGNGDSTADYMQYNFHTAVADAKAAADYMASLDCIDGDAIGVMGWSQGGTDALLACAWEPETFKSLVTWAGAPDMRLDGFFTEADYAEAKANGSFVMEFDWRDSLNVSLQWCDDVANTDVLKEFAEGYDGPVLAIAGTEDDTVDPRWSVRIVEASLHPMSRTHFIEGMDHTFNVFAEEDLHSLKEAVDATGAFFVLTLAN